MTNLYGMRRNQKKDGSELYPNGKNKEKNQVR